MDNMIDTRQQLCQHIKLLLEDNKAQNIQVINTRNTNVSVNTFVIASATSQKHVHSITKNVKLALKHSNLCDFLILEGQKESDWNVIDIGSMMIHIMHERVRNIFCLEELLLEEIEE